ncbi:hypothetical protein GQ53DRAFT_827915 [Thozetella sp. PMI_491]|nr:hypothetical protein GQ53DRAFT_827915 [Thozetella sp. PMI_491]
MSTCDELRPTCSQCKLRSQKCAYATNSVPTWRKGIITFPLPTISKTSLEITEVTAEINAMHSEEKPKEPPRSVAGRVTSLGYQIPPAMAERSIGFDAQDVFLLMHFTSTISKDLLGEYTLWAGDVMQLAFKHDFLMHAILTLSAHHLQDLGRTSPSQTTYDFKSLEAHHLQVSLSTLSDKIKYSILSIQDAVLATSFLLCFHACSAITTAPASEQPCEDASFTFLRGIQSIVADGSRTAHSGCFRVLVAPPPLLPNLSPPGVPLKGPGALFMILLNGLPSSSAHLEHRNIYVERIESLSPYLALSSAQSLDAEALEELLLSCLRWQAFCPPQFVALVKAHDIIALIILAHYYAIVGFMLSKLRDKWWWWRKKPVYMVHAISDYIGFDWALWVEWPREVIRRCWRTSRESALVGMLEHQSVEWGNWDDH